MALQAYPDVPLFRYDYTDLTKAQIADKLQSPALGGPGSKGELENLGAADLRFMAEDGTSLSWQFAPGYRVSLDGGRPAGYGALTLDHVTLIAHLVPDTTRGYAIAWDQRSNRATVAELWFGDGPAPTAREVNRALYYGSIVGVGDARVMFAHSWPGLAAPVCVSHTRLPDVSATPGPGINPNARQIPRGS